MPRRRACVRALLCIGWLRPPACAALPSASKASLCGAVGAGAAKCHSCAAPREPLPTGHPTPIPTSYDGVSTPGGDANPGLYATFGPIDMEADGVFVTPLAAASADATQT